MGTTKEQNLWTWMNQKGNLLEYEVVSKENHEFLGTFGVQLLESGQIPHDGEIEGLGLLEKETAAIILPYTPNSKLDSNESELTDLDKLLDRWTFDLTLKGTKAVVINNDGKPNYSQVAPQLGFSQLPSGLWYVKPSLEVNVNLEEYRPRPDLKSIVGMYFLNISLKPNWNSSKEKVGKQTIDLVPVGIMYDWCKKAMNEQGLTDESLVAEFGDKDSLDFGLGSGIPDFLINSTLEKAIEYFKKVTKVIKQQGHVKGISITVTPGYSQENWCYWSRKAITSLDYKQIDPAQLPGTGLFFKDLSANSAKAT